MASYEKLLNIFEKNLKKNGIAFVATKVYYFGVGGGISEFKAKIKSGVFGIETVSRIENGLSNTREILKLTRL